MPLFLASVSVPASPRTPPTHTDTHTHTHTPLIGYGLEKQRNVFRIVCGLVSTNLVIRTQRILPKYKSYSALNLWRLLRFLRSVFMFCPLHFTQQTSGEVKLILKLPTKKLQTYSSTSDSITAHLFLFTAAPAPK